MNPAVEIRLIALTDIDADADWNSRSANSILSSVSETDEESTGLDGLIANLREHGQDTPVDIRPTIPPFYKRTNRRFSLVAGFRRYSAIEKINDDIGLKAALAPEMTLIPGIQDGYIRAAIHPPMSEEEAFLLNGRENANRETITPPDVFRLIQRATVTFKKTPTEISVWLGKSYPHVLNYVKMQTLPAGVIKHWIEGGEFDGITSGKRIGIQEIIEIAKKKPEEHEVAYKRALVQQVKVANSSAWYEKAKGRAVAQGALLARLQKSGFLTVATPTWMNDINIIVRTGKRELKWSEGRELAGLAEASYKRELEKPSQPGPVLEDEADFGEETIQ